MKDNEDLHWQIVETLSSYIRERSVLERSAIAAADLASSGDRTEEIRLGDDLIDRDAVSEDVDAALRVIARRPWRREGELVTTVKTDLPRPPAPLDRMYVDGTCWRIDDDKTLDLAAIRAPRLTLPAGAQFALGRFDGADLRAARLPESMLGGADLRNADLRGATLNGADLGETVFAAADLRGADLSDSNCGETWFQSATYAVDFRVDTGGATAEFTDAILDKADFRGVRGVYLAEIAESESAIGVLLDGDADPAEDDETMVTYAAGAQDRAG